MCIIIMRVHVVHAREPFNFRTAGGVLGISKRIYTLMCNFYYTILLC